MAVPVCHSGSLGDRCCCHCRHYFFFGVLSAQAKPLCVRFIYFFFFILFHFIVIHCIALLCIAIAHHQLMQRTFISFGDAFSGDPHKQQTQPIKAYITHKRASNTHTHTVCAFYYSLYIQMERRCGRSIIRYGLAILYIVHRAIYGHHLFGDVIFIWPGISSVQPFYIISRVSLCVRSYLFMLTFSLRYVQMYIYIEIPLSDRRYWATENECVCTHKCAKHSENERSNNNKNGRTNCERWTMNHTKKKKMWTIYLNVHDLITASVCRARSLSFRVAGFISEWLINFG